MAGLCLSTLSQTEYNTIEQQDIGHLRCVYTRADTERGDRYNVSLFFTDLGYGMNCDAATKSVSLSDNKILSQFRADLKECITYLELKKKDGKLVYDNTYYTLVIHDFPNRIYVYSSGQSGYTWLNLKAANAVHNWISEIQFPSNS